MIPLHGHIKYYHQLHKKHFKHHGNLIFISSSLCLQLSHEFRSNFLFWHVFCLLQWSVADDVEIVKSVTSEDMEKRDEGGDQVALETAEQEQHIHPPPPHIIQGRLHISVLKTFT